MSDKNWHILQIKPKLKEIFPEPPVLAFKRNNLTEIIGGNKVLTSNFGTQRNLTKENANHVSSDRLIFVTSNLKLKIRHKVTCKRSSVNYLMECCFCKKSEYNLENLNIT